MPKRSKRSDYDLSVFINCPFDDTYKPLFEATLFTVQIAGFKPRCAKEISNAAQARVEKLLDLVEACRLGIHDISRTELGTNGLPRFNMPLELGFDIACRRFGSRAHRRKSLLVMDRTEYRFQKFISDISGQDITPHRNSERQLVRNVRDWLATHSEDIPGGNYIFQQLRRFRRAIPKLCRLRKLSPRELTFGDRIKIVRIWLEEVA